MIDEATIYQAFDAVRAEALELPPRLPLSQWAEENRRIRNGSLWVPYDFESVPYLREPTDALLDPMLEKIAILGASRCGKTEILLHLICFLIARRQVNILVAIPKDSLLKKFLNEKLLPMLRNTPSIRDRVGKHVESLRDKAANATIINFLGGSIVLGNANSSDTWRLTDAFAILLDEVDESKPDIEGQGNVVTLAETRGRTVPGSRVILMGSPTNAKSSLIELETRQSTDERFYVGCPSCGHEQELLHTSLNWQRATLSCGKCYQDFSQNIWLKQARNGRWKSTNPNPVPRTRSFRISGLLSPWLHWDSFCAGWLRAQLLATQGSPQTLKTLTNTSLGIVWEGDEEEERVQFETLWDRREVFESEVPEEILAITAAVDTQDNRLVSCVFGWGLDSEMWVLDYLEISGDPAFPSTWEKLDEQVTNRTFGGLEISRLFVDFGGHRSDHVFAYTKGNGPRVFAIKGFSGEPLSWVTRYPAKGNIPAHRQLDTGAIKTYLDLRLSIQEGPGQIHFPKAVDGQAVRGIDGGYFHDLLREVKRPRIVNGLEVWRWENVGSGRNESWDLMCYGYGALVDLGGSEYLKRLWNLRNAPASTEEPTPPAWLKHTAKAGSGRENNRPSWVK
jgi:phage terminase large subunit GpA-like protein